MKSCIVKITGGTKGTESYDCADILCHMYEKWCENRRFKVDVNKPQGIKTITLKIKGQDVYDLLKNETGVHRVCRISPFDKNKRRYTSFVNVEVSKGNKKEKEMDWTNVARSYIFHPYQLVKDMKTGIETKDVNGVMNGNIDLFLVPEK